VSRGVLHLDALSTSAANCLRKSPFKLALSPELHSLRKGMNFLYACEIFIQRSFMNFCDFSDLNSSLNLLSSSTLI